MAYLNVIKDYTIGYRGRSYTVTTSSLVLTSS